MAVTKEPRDRFGRGGFFVGETDSNLVFSLCDKPKVKMPQAAVMCANGRVKYVLRTSEVRLFRDKEETLRVSIFFLMDKTESFASQACLRAHLARKGKLHAPKGRTSLVALRRTSRAFGAPHFGVFRNDKLQGISKNSSHGESAESFPPELCSDIVTKILRIGSTMRTDFCLD